MGRCRQSPSISQSVDEKPEAFERWMNDRRSQSSRHAPAAPPRCLPPSSGWPRVWSSLRLPGGTAHVRRLVAPARVYVGTPTSTRCPQCGAHTEPHADGASRLGALGARRRAPPAAAAGSGTVGTACHVSSVCEVGGGVRRQHERPLLRLFLFFVAARSGRGRATLAPRRRARRGWLRPGARLGGAAARRSKGGRRALLTVAAARRCGAAAATWRGRGRHVGRRWWPPARRAAPPPRSLNGGGRRRR